MKRFASRKWLLASAPFVLGCIVLAPFFTLPAGEPNKAGPIAKQRTADELSPATFEKLHALIKPDPKVSFERIPWTTSLWGARQKAAAEDKPIVLWSGDPLPLGVT